jgi:uncharacterized tellurite resistance protein B-like protein
MFSFFNKKILNTGLKTDRMLSKIASLFIHAAKMDQDYTSAEENIIKKALINLGAKELEVEKIVYDAEKNENNSNQMLDFTKEIKTLDEKSKIKIVETLWSIIYSDARADMYESNLMRRLSSLLYIDNKTMGNIKENIKKKFAK